MEGTHRMLPFPLVSKKTFATSEECLAEIFPLPFVEYTEGRVLALLLSLVLHDNNIRKLLL